MRATASSSAPPARSSRLRHRARHGARRRLVQFGARLHVRARLHPVAVLPHRPLSDRRLDAGSRPPARARRPGQEPSASTIFSARRCESLAELVAAAGLDHPNQFMPAHFSRRVSPHEVKSFAELYPSLQPGELLAGTGDRRFEIRLGDGERQGIPGGAARGLSIGGFRRNLLAVVPRKRNTRPTGVKTRTNTAGRIPCAFSTRR